MTDDTTRDIAIEARTDIRQIKDMLAGHIRDTKEYREEVHKRVDAIEADVRKHHDAFQQLHGAWKAAAAIGSIVGALVAGIIAFVAKVAGFIRIA